MTSLSPSTTTRSATPGAGVARLNCRVSASIKQRAEEAAGVLGQSITDFTEQALSEKAEAVLSQVERIRLSERDFEHFLQTIQEPGEPAPALRQAAEEYKRLREQEPGGNW